MLGLGCNGSHLQTGTARDRASSKIEITAVEKRKEAIVDTFLLQKGDCGSSWEGPRKTCTKFYCSLSRIAAAWNMGSAMWFFCMSWTQRSFRVNCWRPCFTAALWTLRRSGSCGLCGYVAERNRHIQELCADDQSLLRH